MLNRPSDAPDDRYAAFEDHVRELRMRVLDHVEAMLVDLDAPALAQRVYDLAFTDSDALPKRGRQLKLSVTLLAEQTARYHGLDDREVEALVRFTILSQEYYDMLDDVLDGDVADGSEPAVVLVSQTLMPLFVAELGRLGTDAVAYWSRRSVELMEAPLHEATAEAPSAEAYEALVEQQAILFGFVTGLSATVASEDSAGVDRAERLGRTVYKHWQFVLDVEQHVADGSETWNAGALVDREEIVERLESWRAEVRELTADYPEEPAALIRTLVALDTDAWLDDLEELERDR